MLICLRPNQEGPLGGGRRAEGIESALKRKFNNTQVSG